MVDPREPDLSSLFKQVGYEAPSRDLTAHIMARVAVTPIFRPAEVKPLIGRWGWAAIVVFGACLVGYLMTLGADTPSQVSRTLEQYLPRPQLPEGIWAPWLMAISGCLLLFAMIDRAMARRRTAGR